MLIAETLRLDIRELSLEDAAALMPILGDAAVMEHSVRGVYDGAAVRKFIEWCLGCYASHGVGPWALVERRSSQLIGLCGVGPERVGESERINLGYRLARRHWGRGLATEAARGSLGYAFDVKRFPAVVALIEPDHVASLRVAEKAGFRRFEAARFHGRPVRLYRIAREEWMKAAVAADAPRCR